MAMVPKSIALGCYSRYGAYGIRKLEIKCLRQDLFEAFYKSTDFLWAYYLNPNVSGGNIIYSQYWNKILKLFGWEEG